VNFLRDQYRHQHLEGVAPDRDNGETPAGNWYELVGTAYDRTTYGFEIETTPAQDEAFIRAYNGGPNRSHFRLVSRNCADFAKDVINFYYPKSLHRSLIADVGITTPKQMAKMLIKFSGRHSELQFTRFVIPQVPGSAARSTPVHGVVESFLKSKKYIVPSAVASPIFAGCVAAVYVGTGAGRFDPARQAMVFNAGRDLEAPLGREDRRSYQSELNHLELNVTEHGLERAHTEEWKRLLRKAAPDLDAQGRPVVRVQVGEEVVSIGVAGSNIFANDAPEQFTAQLLEARLRAELRRGSPPKASESDVTRDWNLLQKAVNGSDAEVAVQSRRALQSGSQVRAGNEP
jgi:hypothetical protein